MLARVVEQAIQKIPRVQDTSTRVSRAMHRAVLKGGRPGRAIADALHGTWLGHPLHPVLTDITVGAWSLSAVFDVIAARRGDRFAERAADALISAGLISAVPTAISGMADYSTVQKPAAPTATLHAVLNEINVVLYLFSLQARRRGNRRRGLILSGTAIALTVASAWLGGHLVYNHQVGVDHSRARKGPDRWTPVLDAVELPEQTPKRVDADGSPVLLYRLGGTIHAIGAVCSHAGGPLDEGHFEAHCVQCPWHDSVFDLRNGDVRHGPATRAQPCYEAREQNGRIEVRLAEI